MCPFCGDLPIIPPSLQDPSFRLNRRPTSLEGWHAVPTAASELDGDRASWNDLLTCFIQGSRSAPKNDLLYSVHGHPCRDGGIHCSPVHGELRTLRRCIQNQQRSSDCRRLQ
jgi:hypothetical protein